MRKKWEQNFISGNFKIGNKTFQTGENPSKL